MWLDDNGLFRHLADIHKVLLHFNRFTIGCLIGVNSAAGDHNERSQLAEVTMCSLPGAEHSARTDRLIINLWSGAQCENEAIGIGAEIGLCYCGIGFFVFADL